MKPLPVFSQQKTNQARQGFTLPELMMAMTVFSLVMAGLLSVHLMGLRIFEITKVKLIAVQKARESVSQIVEDVRSAKTAQVGEGDDSHFSPAAPGELQKGNALRIFLSTNTNSFIQYYRDDEDKLIRTLSSNRGSMVMARNISNKQVFTAEDFQGNLLTNPQNNRVIGLLMQFNTAQSSNYLLGPRVTLDYDQLLARVTRRALE